MKFENWELIIVATCCYNVEYIPRVNLNLITHESLSAVLKYIIDLKISHEDKSHLFRDLAGIDPNIKIPEIVDIDRNILMDIINGNSKQYVPIAIIDSISEEAQNMTKYGRESVEKNFNTAIDRLKERERLVQITGEIDRAKSLILDGNENKGLMILKGLKFVSTEKLESTIELMMRSVAKSDGFPSGIRYIDDNHGGWQKGNLMAIHGVSGSQKTYVSIWLVLKALEANPEMRALYFEKEMTAEEIGLRLVSYFMLKNSADYRKISSIKDKDRQEDAIHEAIMELREKLMKDDNPKRKILDRFIVVPHDKFDSMDDIYKMVDSEKANIWAMDYATMLNPVKTEESFDLFMKREMQTAKLCVDSTKSLGIIISQVKVKNDIQTRANKIPAVDEMEWGKHLHQLSAWVFACFYPWQFYQTDKMGCKPDWFFLINQKNRYGSQFMIPLISKASYSLFEDPPLSLQSEMRDWVDNYNTNRRSMPFRKAG